MSNENLDKLSIAALQGDSLEIKSIVAREGFEREHKTDIFGGCPGRFDEHGALIIDPGTRLPPLPSERVSLVHGKDILNPAGEGSFLLEAVRSQHPEAASQTLIGLGADTNHCGGFGGLTPLEVARNSGSAVTAEILSTMQAKHEAGREQTALRGVVLKSTKAPVASEPPPVVRKPRRV